MVCPELLFPLNQFNLVTFGGVNEGEDRAGGSRGRAVGEFQAEAGQVAAKGFEVLDFEREVGEVGLDLDRAAAGETGDFNLLLAVGGLEEDQFGAAGGFVPPDFAQAQDIAVKGDGAFEVIHAIPGMEQFLDEAHAWRIAQIGPSANPSGRGVRFLISRRRFLGHDSMDVWENDAKPANARCNFCFSTT